MLRSFAGAVRIGVVYGGLGYATQIKALRRGVDILIACPGRLEDLIAQVAVSLSATDRVVLDEADRMADMGFMPAVRRLLDQTVPKRQTMLFSATLDGDVAKLTHDYQQNPVRHEVGAETPDITAAHHVFWNIAPVDRPGITAEAVSAVWPAIVFCRTRHRSDRLARQLGKAGIQAAAIHGGRRQSQRTRALADFASGRVQALVATDVAARGIHVDGVASVVHYESPEDHKTYVHRSGRTARGGHGGVVVSLVQPDQVKGLRRLQRQIGLNEPFTTPDANALRDLSRSPAPTNPAATVEAHEIGLHASRHTSRAAPKTHQNHSGRATSGRHKGRPKKGRNRQKASQAHDGGRSWGRNKKTYRPSRTSRSTPNLRNRRSHQLSRAAG